MIHYSADPPKALEQFRTRWRRWLGNKTRLDKPYYVTLLESRWSGWVWRVYDDCGLAYERPGLLADPLTLRALWRKAIDHADMDMLRRLDGLYAAEKAGL